MKIESQGIHVKQEGYWAEFTHNYTAYYASVTNIVEDNAIEYAVFRGTKSYNDGEMLRCVVKKEQPSMDKLIRFVSDFCRGISE